MNFLVKAESETTEDTIIISCNKRCQSYVATILKYIEKIDTVVSCYDDEHNMFLIPAIQIYYIENIDNKVYIYTAKQTYRIYHRFSYVKKEYEKFGLHQINKNTLVNTHHVASVKVAADCRRVLHLDNKEKLIVNRQFRDFMEQ